MVTSCFSTLSPTSQETPQSLTKWNGWSSGEEGIGVLSSGIRWCFQVGENDTFTNTAQEF